LNDLNKWMLLHLNKGKFNNERIISENLINQMFSPQMADQNPMPFAEVIDLCSGLGWFTLNYRGHRMVSHSGFFGSCLYFIPAKGIALVYLPTMNTYLHEVIPYSIFDRLLGLPELPWNERYKAHKSELAETQRSAEEDSKKKNPQIMDTCPSHSLEDYIGLYKHPALWGIGYKAGGQ
jgi:CubicO group peptidase (beta-lactamase class C family)